MVGDVKRVDLDPRHDRVGQHQGEADRDGRDDPGERGRDEQADGDRSAGLPDQAQDLGQRRCRAHDGLFEALPATAQILWALGLLWRLEGRVAGQAAVGRPAFGIAPASPPTSPPDDGPVGARRHHSHVSASLREVIGTASALPVRLRPSGAAPPALRATSP